jgi:hypothetical protein
LIPRNTSATATPATIAWSRRINRATSLKAGSAPLK